MSDTPRTDVAEHNMGSIVEPHYVVDIAFARQLERKLAEAQEELNDRRKFAYAVEQALERELANAVAAERERCARVCEERGSFNSVYAHHILTGAAEAIRKGEKESLTVAERKPVPEFELIEKWEGE